jgi:hypothetical protein
MKDLPPKGGWKLKRDSLTKLILWFHDGNIRTLYSLDWRHSYSARDREIGLERFQKRIELYGKNVRAARIYDATTRDLLKAYPVKNNQN